MITFCSSKPQAFFVKTMQENLFVGVMSHLMTTPTFQSEKQEVAQEDTGVQDNNINDTDSSNFASLCFPVEFVYMLTR